MGLNHLSGRGHPRCSPRKGQADCTSFARADSVVLPACTAACDCLVPLLMPLWPSAVPLLASPVLAPHTHTAETHSHTHTRPPTPLLVCLRGNLDEAVTDPQLGRISNSQTRAIPSQPTSAGEGETQRSGASAGSASSPHTNVATAAVEIISRPIYGEPEEALEGRPHPGKRHEAALVAGAKALQGKGDWEMGGMRD